MLGAGPGRRTAGPHGCPRALSRPVPSTPEETREAYRSIVGALQPGDASYSYAHLALSVCHGMLKEYKEAQRLHPGDPDIQTMLNLVNSLQEGIR